MALPVEPLSIVEQWKKKSIEMSSESNDSIVTLLGKSIDTMAIVLSKKSDLKRVQRALVSLESERLVSLQFDDLRNDELRSLVYGQIESLHFTLNELTKERKKEKDCGEMFTQTDQELSEPALTQALLSEGKKSAVISTQTDKELPVPSLDPFSSNDYADQSRDDQSMFPNLFEFPKEEPFDESPTKIEDLWGDSVEIKDEEMPNDDVALNNMGADSENEALDETDDMVGDRGDVSNIVDNDAMAQSEMPALDHMGDGSHFENGDIDETEEKMNVSNENEIIGGDTEDDREKNSTETIEVENKRRSSRNVSKQVEYADKESLNYSDEDYEPSMKIMKDDSPKRKNKKIDGVNEKKGRLTSSKAMSRQMKCPECEFQTTSATSFVEHLKRKHSTNLKMAGLALRCDCGVEAVSFHHSYKCGIANFIVVRKRDGPIHRIKKEKTTPQCLLCGVYPKTPRGYCDHLEKHHKSNLSANGIYILCSCGAKFRNAFPDSNHTKECTRREFTLHKVADK